MYTKDTKDTCRVYFRLLDRVIPFYEEFKYNAYIAGGAIRSLTLGEDIKDVDIFLRDKSLIDRLKELDGVFVSSNAISFYLDKVQYQIITTITGSPKEVINEFDFIMNMNYYDPYYDVCYRENREIIHSKMLDFNPKCRNKLGTLARLEKFLNRGYITPNRNSILELGVALTQQEPVTTFEELEKQSKLYFSKEQYDEIDFVEKDEPCNEYVGTRSGSGGSVGSGV